MSSGHDYARPAELLDGELCSSDSDLGEQSGRGGLVGGHGEGAAAADRWAIASSKDLDEFMPGRNQRGPPSARKPRSNVAIRALGQVSDLSPVSWRAVARLVARIGGSAGRAVTVPRSLDTDLIVQIRRGHFREKPGGTYFSARAAIW